MPMRPTSTPVRSTLKYKPSSRLAAHHGARVILVAAPPCSFCLAAMSRVNLKAEDFPEVLRKDCMLFYAPEMEGLARKIAAVSPSGAVLQTSLAPPPPALHRRFRERFHLPAVRLSNIRWAKFESEFPNLFVEDALEVRNKHVAFLASFHHPAVIFEQLSIIYALPRLFVASFTLVLPFFPTGTMERMEVGGARGLLLPRSPRGCGTTAARRVEAPGSGAVKGAFRLRHRHARCSGSQNEGDVATAFTLARILSNIPLSRGGPTSVVIFDIHALQERFYFDDTGACCGR